MVKVFFIIGIIAFFISGASMGAWTDRQGFHEETEEHRNFRLKNGAISAIIGVLFLAIALVIYYFQNN